MTANPNPSERRSEARRAVSYIGILTDKVGVPHYCMVTEESDSGVRVQTRWDVPEEFFLQFPGVGATREGRYRVIWRLNGAVGARRINADAKA